MAIFEPLDQLVRINRFDIHLVCPIPFHSNRAFHRPNHLHIINKHSLRPHRVRRLPNKQKQPRKPSPKYFLRIRLLSHSIFFHSCRCRCCCYCRSPDLFSGGTKKKDTVMPLLINYSSWHRKSLKPICSVFCIVRSMWVWCGSQQPAETHEYIIYKVRPVTAHRAKVMWNCILLVNRRWPPLMQQLRWLTHTFVHRMRTHFGKMRLHVTSVYFVPGIALCLCRWLIPPEFVPSISGVQVHYRLVQINLDHKIHSLCMEWRYVRRAPNESVAIIERRTACPKVTNKRFCHCFFLRLIKIYCKNIYLRAFDQHYAHP